MVIILKDPAFLFYSSDFLSGTMLMTNEEIGKYIRLLCLQHQKGHLREKDLLSICQQKSEEIFSKFIQDENGNYYNQRLEIEINKRNAYSESRRNNRKKKEENNISKTYEKDMLNICNSYVEHMENENINENINEIVNRDNRGMGEEEEETSANCGDCIEHKKAKTFCKPTVAEITNYCLERNNRVDAQRFYDFYESKGWLIGKNKMKDWKACVRTWEKNSNERSANNQATAQDYFDYAEELRRQGL